MTDTLIRLTGMYENTSQRTGRRYYVGYLGGAKLLLLEDTKAEDGKPGWQLCIAERPQRSEPAASLSAPRAAADPPRRAERTAVARRHREMDRAADAASERDDGAPFNDPLPF